MKILFGMNITKSRKEPEIWGDELVVQTLPPEQVEALKRETDKLQYREERLKLPEALRWVKAVSMVATLGLLGAIIHALIINPFINIPEHVYVLCYIMLGFGFIWGVLELAQWIRKALRGSEKLRMTQQARVYSMMQNAYATLGVPMDAATVDVLVSCFKVKGDKPFLMGVYPATFINPEMRAYRMEDTLYLASTEKKYAIPLAGIKGFEKNRFRVSIFGWNKEQDITEEPFNAYKIRPVFYGYTMKPYYALEFEHEGEQWRLLIPPYELSTFEYLVGKEAKQGLFS